MQSIRHLIILIPYITLTLARQPSLSLQTATSIPSSPDIQFFNSLAKRKTLLLPRGGATHHDDIETDDKHTVAAPSDNLPKSSFRHNSSVFLSRIYPSCRSIVLRMKRGIVAGWDAAWKDCEEDDASLPMLHSFLGRTGSVCREVYWGVLKGDEAGSESCDSTKEESVASSTERHSKPKRRHRHKRRRKHRPLQTTSPTSIANGGGIDPTESQVIQSLAQKYNIETNPQHHSSIFMSSHTSFQEALQKSNEQARFLICYLSTSPTDDKLVLPHLLHPQFTKVMSRKPLGKKNLIPNTGSFTLYICQQKSIQSDIIKRLKLKPSSKQQTVLCILYPATALDPSNKLRVIPKLLAQHHCNPPLSSVETCSSWVSTVRKRYFKQYAKLQFNLKEKQLLLERNANYRQSIVEDGERELREEEERRKKMQEEERERERLEMIQERRKQLLEELREEPPEGITIALRFQTVSSTDPTASTQRKFAKSDTMNTIFNWIDAMHGLEREKIGLCTMNGSRNFVYDDGEDLTLEEVGLGKMTALRVLEREVEKEDGSGDDEEEDASSDDGEDSDGSSGDDEEE